MEERANRSLLLATAASIAAVLLAAAIGYAANGGRAEPACQPDRDVRWINVCLTPYLGDYVIDDRYIIFERSLRGRWTPQLVIDGRTGRVVDDGLESFAPGSTARTVRSIRVMDGPSRVWPFVEGEPIRYDVFGRYTVGVPDPAAGIRLGFDGCTSAAPDRCALLIEHGQDGFSLQLEPSRGQFIHPNREVQQGLERLVASVSRAVAAQSA